MIVATEYVDVQAGGSPMRMFVAAPTPAGSYPGILCYSDIFQLTGPMLRACIRLAGYGFVSAAQEIYHRIERPGDVIPFDDRGRTRGLENASKTAVAHFDEDRRAALEADVRATVCYYGTGIHDGKLGQDWDAGSLARADEIRGKLLMVWGGQDPHVPAEGRALIDRKLREAGVDYAVKVYPCEHAFMRDEGARYDPEATDQAFGDMIGLFRGVFGPSYT